MAAAAASASTRKSMEINVAERPAAPNPFATPYGSMPASRVASTTAVFSRKRPYFRSRRIKKGEVERPWLEKKDPREKWVWIIPVIGIVVGFALSAYIIWDGTRKISNYKYCQVLDEDFSRGFDPNVWTKEVESGGYGYAYNEVDTYRNGQFEMTTNTDENAYVQDGLLYLKPTLQDQNLIETNNTVDLTELGICSSIVFTDCVSATNTTNGTIVNPIKSARLSTKASTSIKYGRVEVVARLPAGDWLWPAIWMLPKNDTYGQWPASGEIDIAESRGNNYTYPQGGNQLISSTLHWGPSHSADGWWRNHAAKPVLLSTYPRAFHTFGLEWTPKYLFTYVDSRLAQVIYTGFNKPFWQKGDFPVADANGTRFVDPWSQTGNLATPFDQDFYLLINLAVGGTNGWFQDGIAGKPWVDASTRAKLDFWNARDQWLPTWKDGGAMEIKSVKMWQQEGFNGCSS
ncbi:hypothetical protein LTR95_012809 [Oleoguttula sp. CCFEE 5521]